MPAPLKQVLLFDSEILRDYNPPKGTPYSDYEAFAEIKPGLVQFVKNSNATFPSATSAALFMMRCALSFTKCLNLASQ